MFLRRRAMAVVATTIAAAGIGLATAGPSLARSDERPPAAGGSLGPTAVPAAGTFYPVAPQRLLGSEAGGHAFGPGGVAGVSVAGHGGLPSSGVSAVLVNVITVADAAAATSLSFAPTGSTAPAPLVTVPAGATSSTLLTVPLATAGAFDVTASSTATVSVDVVGFYAADDTVVASHGISGGYQPVETTRLYDSARTGPLGPRASARFAVDLGTAVNAHATALLLLVAVKGDTTTAGTLTVSSAGGAPSGSVAFAAGRASSNLALVTANPHSVDLLDVVVSNTSAGAAGVDVDLLGFYDDGSLGPNLRFRPLPQTRVLDTLKALGVTSLQPGRRATLAPSRSVVGDSTFGLVGVLTGSAGATTVLRLDDTEGTASDSVDVPLDTTPASLPVQPEVGARGRLSFTVPGGGPPVTAELDVVGSFEAYPPVGNPAARGWVPPVSSWQISAPSAGQVSAVSR
jgi:hypothetical protein